MIVIYAFIYVFGFTGNLLIVKVSFSILKQNSAISSSRYILNLAIADIFLIKTLPLTCYATYYNYWPFGDVGCKSLYGVREINRIDGIYTLVFLSFDRFCA
ncbi:hypothetical protein HELRODRAFT_78185, partial [Helobdella robusta]|uniref:G-protein coupled receptors family 1 profile domain-containing protein n=1 Tax=Helobdella robusta TaxID=6412 RepID=T1G390_HELRO